MRYRIERSRRYGGPFGLIFMSPSPQHPSSLGLIGQKGERVRVVCADVEIELWEWSERIPVNPGDLQCTDFTAGWKLIKRKDSPVPSADELAHFFIS